MGANNAGKHYMHGATARTHKWTEEQTALLRSLWGQVSAPEIAALVSKTTNAVIGKAHRLGLPEVPKSVANSWASATHRARLAVAVGGV